MFVYCASYYYKWTTINSYNLIYDVHRRYITNFNTASFKHNNQKHLDRFSRHWGQLRQLVQQHRIYYHRLWGHTWEFTHKCCCMVCASCRLYFYTKDWRLWTIWTHQNRRRKVIAYICTTLNLLLYLSDQKFSSRFSTCYKR